MKLPLTKCSGIRISVRSAIPFSLLLLLSCDKIADPPARQEGTYIPLAIGDTRQLAWLSDSSTVLMKVVETRKRSDGTDVFAMEWTTGTSEPDTLFYLLKDGYFAATRLDSSGDVPGNPFFEQRLAKANPVNGETWKHTPGSMDTVSFTARFFPLMDTPAGRFESVFGFVLTEKMGITADTILTPFYALNVGYIGTDIDKDFAPEVVATYVKVGSQEVGSMWPSKNPTAPRSVLSHRLHATTMLLGSERIP